MNKSKNPDALRERESHSLNKGGVKYDTSIC